jgi:hypothetical protein
MIPVPFTSSILLRIQVFYRAVLPPFSSRDALGRDCVTERRACRVLGQSRSTQRRCRQVPSDEPRLMKRIVEMASEYGRYGYRRVTALLHQEGWQVNHKRVERIWRHSRLHSQRQRSGVYGPPCSRLAEGMSPLRPP